MRAELAGIKAAEIELEIRGRELILAGHRRPQDSTEDRLYQQLEVQHGPFRRVIALGADVDAEAARATYEDGMLTVELPIVAPAGSAHRSGPARRRGPVIEIATPGAGEEPVPMGAPPRVPARLPVLPLRDTVTFPDTLTPLAVGQERSVRLVNDVLGGDRMLAMVASRDPELESPGPEQLYEVGVARHRGADAQGARRDAADPGPGRPARAPDGLGRASSPTSSPTSRRRPTSCTRARS